MLHKRSAFEKNQIIKFAKYLAGAGEFLFDKSILLWKHWIEQVAPLYGVSYSQINTATRKELARKFASYYFQLLTSGAPLRDHEDWIPAKYRKDPNVQKRIHNVIDVDLDPDDISAGASHGDHGKDLMYIILDAGMIGSGVFAMPKHIAMIIRPHHTRKIIFRSIGGFKTNPEIDSFLQKEFPGIIRPFDPIVIPTTKAFIAQALRHVD